MAFGLALLYASAYFLPFLNPYSLYFVPSFFSYIVIPSLVSVALLTPLFLLCSSSMVSAQCRRGLVYFGTIILTFIAAKSMFDAAGYPWSSLLSHFITPSHAGATQDFRLGRVMLVAIAAGVALVFVHSIRHRMSELTKFLSALGYAFLFLAMYRCLAGDMVAQSADQIDAAAINRTPASSHTARRVVWVIFDEMDYALSFQTDAAAASHLPNFSRLASNAVSATDAYSPGRDTLYSIPALLTGTAISGVAFDQRSNLDLLDQQGKSLPFIMKNSLFARLPQGPGSASVLGFYHPYCKIIPALQSCHSTYLGNAGRWFDSLTFFSEAVFSTLRHVDWALQYSPDWLLFSFDPMYRATSDVLSRLDGTLRKQDSSLDFIHLNLPHLPNVYVQRLMRQPVGNEMDAYRQNLAGADMVLGQIIRNLEANAKNQDTLLIVSSDHWLRTHSKRPASVPFLAWRVGAHTGQVVHRPLSTVHSAELALDFLNGEITSQPEIADRLRRATLSPTWIAPDGYRY